MKDPLDDNIDLKDTFKSLKDKYEMVFDYTNKLKVMSGPATKIELLENVQIHPLHVNTPRRTAYAHQKAAKEEDDRHVHLSTLAN